MRDFTTGVMWEHATWTCQHFTGHHQKVAKDGVPPGGRGAGRREGRRAPGAAHARAARSLVSARGRARARGDRGGCATRGGSFASARRRARAHRTR